MVLQYLEKQGGDITGRNGGAVSHIRSAAYRLRKKAAEEAGRERIKGNRRKRKGLSRH